MADSRPQFDRKKILKEEQTLLDCFSGEKRGFIATLFRFYKGNYKNFVVICLVILYKIIAVVDNSAYNRTGYRYCNSKTR